jgi:DMSO reductase family type II enzyme iron-sulfur subunit
MGTIDRQVRMLFDLNKCIGCHTCTMACKTMWTDRNEGQMYMYWNNVETQPGKGYPKNWQQEGALSGWNGCDDAAKVQWSPLKRIESDYGAPWAYNYSDVLRTGGGSPSGSVVVPFPEPAGTDAYASNWDEDVGEGEMPNNYYFYLPRICNHCSKPACVPSCPRQSVYKRKEDGIVLIDQERCRGYRFCVQGCPYKKIYFNPVTKKSEKCIFCYPRIEQGQANFCVAQCVGRIRWVAYADNADANLNKLVEVHRVALRLHPEFGTEPNTFYIPPLSPPGYYGGQLGTQRRIPTSVLAKMFGDDCSQTLAEREARVDEILDKLQWAKSNPGSDLARILIATSDYEQVQLT